LQERKTRRGPGVEAMNYGGGRGTGGLNSYNRVTEFVVHQNWAIQRERKKQRRQDREGKGMIHFGWTKKAGYRWRLKDG